MRKKYPRTLHVPFSPGATSDDKVLKSLAHLQGKEVVITIKMDGENTTLYRDGFHARSLDSQHHPSRDWLARFHAEMGYNIPAEWRICGENLYAKHSLEYKDLPHYFMAFSVWHEVGGRDYAMSWDDTVEALALLNLQSVPVLYRGEFSEALLRSLIAQLDLTQNEGLVIRLAESFAYEDFTRSVAKWVRKGHVQTDEHWMHGTIVPNRLKAMT